MSARVTLKPCPSGCTTAAVVTGGDGPWHISHVECGCGWRGQEFIAPTAREADEMAATSWNTREQATAELVEALREAFGALNAAAEYMQARATEWSEPFPLERAEGQLVALETILSRHTEPTDADLLDQVCRGMEEVSKPLTTVSSDAPENAGARATEPSERGQP